MKYNGKTRLFLLLVLCLALLAGCAGSGGKTAGKTEQRPAASGDKTPAQSASPAQSGETEATEEAFQEQTPDQINGKDSGGEDGDETPDILSAVADSLISGTEGSIPPEELRPDNDFAGTFANDAYLAQIVKTDSGEMLVTIMSAEAGPAACTWTMSGFFSDETYRVRFADAVKTVAGGAETEYENGSGTIQFTDPDHFLWNNSMEPIDDRSFRRVQTPSE